VRSRGGGGPDERDGGGALSTEAATLSAWDVNIERSPPSPDQRSDAAERSHTDTFHCIYIIIIVYRDPGRIEAWRGSLC